MGTINYDKMSKKCCGIKGLRLNRRFSVQRLRINFLYIFGVFRRWKNSYRKTLRLLKRKLVRRRQDQDQRGGLVENFEMYSSSGRRQMAHSNSFCSEAIQDCLEFIKRNSVSLDDDRNPMLKSEAKPVY